MADAILSHGAIFRMHTGALISSGVLALGAYSYLAVFSRPVRALRSRTVKLPRFYRARQNVLQWPHVPAGINGAHHQDGSYGGNAALSRP